MYVLQQFASMSGLNINVEKRLYGYDHEETQNWDLCQKLILTGTL